ncbi:uncharacterized protein LOC110459549 isoform X2 [Mizuhopecten yessoensis]|uniref:uncharacterized protein LOC110459549 isoform X2 n=1 Tax=Mizuhopecten yessoensis TaxID=6573 RepID=UPI000B45A139|nr:uncharacterized protein LOC110459549 isoform X2 [Mizuhopecten yessoensis]
MSFAVPIRSKREPGRRAGGLARIFMQSMKEIKQNKPVRISNKEPANNPTSVSEALPHNVPKNLHVANEKTESVTVEKPPPSSSSSHDVLASHVVHGGHREHPTKRTETKISECDKVPSSTQVGYNLNGQQESSLPVGRPMTERDVQGKDATNNTVSRTSVQETATVVKSEKSALCESAVNHVSNASVIMDKEVDSVGVQNISNKRDVFKSSRFVASHGTTNRSRQEKNSIFNKPLPRRYSQRRHTNNSRERVVEKVEPEDWSSDLLEIEIEEGCFYDSNETEKSSGVSVGCTKHEGKLNMGQNDKLVKDEKESVKRGNQEGEEESEAESKRDQRECNTHGKDTEINCLTNADKKTTEEKNKVNLETELNEDKPHENRQISKKSLETDVIVVKSSETKRIVGKYLDKEQTCGNNFGNESLSGKTLDISTQTFDTKQLKDKTAAREDTVFNSIDKEQIVPEIRDCEIEQIVPEIRDCEIEQDSEKEKEKDLYTGCDAYKRKADSESRNIGVKTEDECETETSEKLETTGSSLVRSEETTGSLLVRSEKNTMEQSENVVSRNEEKIHFTKEQQSEMEDKQKCEPVNGGEKQEIQDCRKEEYDQKQSLTCSGNLENMSMENDEREYMRMEIPPLRVPVCDIPAYYNRRRNSGTLSDTSNASHSSSSQKIPSKDIGCCNSWESKTAPIPSLLSIKSSPWRDYSSASSDSSSVARSSRPRPKKPKKKSKYTKSIARGHTLTVSPIQRSPSGSPTSHKNIRGRQSGTDTKTTYNSLINSKVQALSVEMKAKVLTPPDSDGRTMMAKPVMYRDSLRAMKQVRVKAGLKNPSARQVRSEQSKKETSKMEPIIIAQVSSEPKRLDNSASKYTERRQRNYSESSKDESSDSIRHGKSKPIIIPQVSSEPATEEIRKSIGDDTWQHTIIPQVSSESATEEIRKSIADNTWQHTIIPQVSSEPKFRDNSESTGNTSLEKAGKIKSDSRIQDSPDFRNHHHSGSTTDGRLRSGFQIYSEQTVNQEGKSESTRVVLNTQESTPIQHGDNACKLKQSPEFKDQNHMELEHKEPPESVEHLNQEARNSGRSEDICNEKSGQAETSQHEDLCNQKVRHSETSQHEDICNQKVRHSETSQPEDHLNQESSNPESQNLDVSDSRDCDLKSCDNPKFGIKGTTNLIQQERSFKGHNSSEHVRQEKSSRGHSSSKSVRQDKSFQGRNISCEGHNSSEQRTQESSSRGHSSSKSVKQDNSSHGHSSTEPRRQDKPFQDHTSPQPLRQNNSSGGHSISESIRNINSCKGHNRSQSSRQNYSSSHHNRLKPTQQDKSFSTHNSSEPLRKDNSSTTDNRSEPTRQDNSSSTDNRSEPSRQDNSSTTDNTSKPSRQDNSSTTDNRSEPTRQDNSSSTDNRSEPSRQDNSSTSDNRSEPIRHDKSSQDHTRSRLGHENDSSQSHRSSESRIYRSSESRDQNRSQHGKYCYAEHSSYHQDRSGSRCFHNDLGSSRIVHSEPKGTNSTHWESVSCTTLSRGNIGSEKEQGSKKPVSSDPKQPGHSSMEHKYQKSQKKLGENLKVNHKYDREANDSKQVESSEYENWDTDLLPVVTPPGSSINPSDDGVKFTKEGVSATNVSMLTSESRTENASDKKLEKLEVKEENEKGTVLKFETSDGPAIRIKEHVMDVNSFSGQCGKDTHNQSLQYKTDQQQENKRSEANRDIKHQAGQHNSRSFWLDYKTNSVTFRDVRNYGTYHGQVNGHGTDADQKNAVCKTCGRSQFKSSSNTQHNCTCQRTSSVPKGGHVTLNRDSPNTVWYPSSKQHCKSTCQQENYGCGMEQNQKKSDYRKDMNRIEDNGTSGRRLTCSSKNEHHLNVDLKSSQITENGDKDLEKVLVVQPMHTSGNHTRNEWNRIGDQRKNYERKFKCHWFDSDRQQNPVLDEPEENWDSHLLDIEGILKTQEKTETMEQVVPGEQEFKKTSLYSNNNPTGKPPEGGSHTRHQLEEWDSTLLDLNLIGTSVLEHEDNKIISEEEILAEKPINNEWCEVQTCGDSVSKVRSGLSSDSVTSGCLKNVEEEDGSIIPQSDSSLSGIQETSEFEDVCTSDDVMESYVFLSQEECCAHDVPLDSTSCTQTSTDLEMEKLYHKPQTSPGTYRPPVFSRVDNTMYARHSDVDFRAVENDCRHRPDLKQEKGSPPGYGPKECVCPPGCVQFWTWRCCFCHWGWEPRICDVRSALDYSDNFTSQSTEDKDSTENGIRMHYSPRGLLATRSNSVIPPPPSRELWNQMQQGTAPVNSFSPRGTGPHASPANMPQTRKPFPRIQYPGSYPYPPECGSQPQQVMSYGMRHCSPYRLQFRPSSPLNDAVSVEQNIVGGKSIYNRESTGCVSFVSRDDAKKKRGELGKPPNLMDCSTGLTSAKEGVSADEMQDLQLNSPKLVDYGFSETDDSEEEKKDQLAKSRVALFGKDDQSQDSDCSSEKRKLDVEEQELNDDEDCSVGHKRRHVLPRNNIYHFIRHSLNTKENEKDDDKKATAYVPPHRRQKITLTDGPESDSQRAKENERKTPKNSSSNYKHSEVSSSASEQSSSSPGSYPWAPFWASPPPPAMGMSVSPLFGHHQPPCMYPPSCYFSPPNWYQAGSGTDSYGGAYHQPNNHSPSTNASDVKSPTTPHPTKESIPELSKLQAHRKSPERLVLPPRIKFLERTRLLGSNTDSESSSSFHLVDWKANFKEKCRSYCGTFIDSHCHLDFLFNRQGFRGTWSKYKIVHEATMPDCFEGCVAVFCHPGSFRQEGLWKEIALEEDVWLAFGCHPKNATEFSPRAEEGLIRCLQHKRVVALGEIGLDYSGIFKQHKTSQKIVFIKQIQLALEMNKPLVIHCREAEEDALQILEETVPRNYRIHCHCFTGNYQSAKKWMNLFPNLYIGLTPLVTYRTATPSHEVARFIPLDRLLLETDAPYFIPRKFPKEEVHFSHPGMAITVAEHVAFLKRCSVTEVLHACRQNTRTMYGI